ncbi:sterol carrier protein [Nocardioides sp. zg-ZUI104]|uniref:sterol carrier protein n=1 Tax=Nocardioides faecalis TaxID=2803858 RepID=UPI001BCB5C4F|nr:sterol carrier protein [Nocardioides faecalis]MBS4752115.1 sterol carrier protein [Nocardioides faecalis]
MGFKDADEVRHFVGGVFLTGFAHPEIGPRLRDSGVVLRLVFTEPASELVVDMPGGWIGAAEDLPEPTVVMRVKAAFANAYFQGRLNLPLAIARRQIAVEGALGGVLKLAPLSAILVPDYVASLRAAHRDDLIVR